MSKLSRVLVVYDKVGSGQWHRANALQRYCPSDFEITISLGMVSGTYDTVLLPWDLGSQFGEEIRSRGARSVLYWGRSTAVPRANTVPRAIVVPSNVEVEDSGLCRVCTIPNGVDLDLFWASSYTRPNTVLWGVPECSAGSRGKELIEPLRKALKLRKISLDVRVFSARHRYSPEEMREWFGTGAVYLELGDPGGHATQAFEAAACGCGVVGVRGKGNLDGLLEAYPECLVEMDVKSILSGIVLCLDSQVGKRLAQNIRPWGWHVRVQDYFNLLRNLA